MSSNRTILESLLYAESNATTNDPHDNQTNPVRARLANRLELKRSPLANTSLPHTMTVASPNGTVFQLASERGTHLDATFDRNLLNQLGLDPVDSTMCIEAGDVVYLNNDCHPYFKYKVGSRDNDDTRSTFSTTLAMFACSENMMITPEQQIAMDSYCRYNDNINPLTKFLPFALIPLAFACLIMGYYGPWKDFKYARQKAAEAKALSNSHLTESLLGQTDQTRNEHTNPLASYRS
jgi:hypothetical protein